MAILPLALGIGANTAIYSFIDGVMLRALPVQQCGTTSPNFPYLAFELLRDHNDALPSLFGHAGAEKLNLVIDGNAELAGGQYVTGSFFSGLGVAPAAGRLIDLSDDRFGASPSVVGKHIQINGTSFEIAGVSTPEFYGVSPAANRAYSSPWRTSASRVRRLAKVCFATAPIIGSN